MLVHNKKLFVKGLTLLGSFFVVLFFIFSPVLTDEQGRKVNGLTYSDELFNSLAKGSAYYIPAVSKKVAGIDGSAVDVTVKQKDAEAAAEAAKLVNHAGLTAEVKDNAVHINGDLGKMLGMVVSASDKLYMNDSQSVAEMFGDADGMKSMKAWWGLLNPLVKELQKQKKVEEAEAVNMVTTKAVEPAYNFFGIKGEKVAERVPVVVSLLIFYVIYTMWYGYAIFDIFNGIGLSMNKSKAKKEA
ncbi:MAG: hypothetical protein AUJ49_12540 [Desulfovibrionaceae bacterium CG1_02_65_16]|nr:MAG: hypothetical protein AUJ49_12540 [Desulfovibrionaceae bacterium CG1_02_65_16]